MQEAILLELSKAFTEIPFNSLLGLRLGVMSEKNIEMNFSMQEKLIGNFVHGILHGGVISSVLDMAGGVAVMTALAHKKNDKTFEEIAAALGKCSTVNLNINYIRPGKGNHFIAKAKVVHMGNKISFARMKLYNQDSVLIANGSGTYLIG